MLAYLLPALKITRDCRAHCFCIWIVREACVQAGGSEVWGMASRVLQGPNLHHKDKNEWGPLGRMLRDPLRLLVLLKQLQQEKKKCSRIAGRGGARL